MQKTKHCLGLFGLSYLTGIALARISHYSFTRIDIILPCLMALGTVVYYHAGKQEYKKEGKYVLPISFVFALTLVVGSKVHVDEETFESFGALDVLALPVLTLLFSAVLVLLLNYTDQRREGHPSEVSRFRLTVLYSLCYLPYYLTFFPGNCGADTFESVNIALGNQPWTNHQPVLFTVLIKLIVDLIKGFLGLRGSLGVFSFIHMVVFAAVLSWLTCRIMQTTAPVWVKLFTAAFFALHPIIAMYSIYLTKDVIFGEILVILIMKLYDLAESRGELLKSPKFCLQTGALFLLSAMLRNNGLYILLGMTVVLLVVYAACRKQILLMALTVICLYAVWQGPVFRTLGIEKQSFAESASIPLQQIGYVIWTDGNVGEEEAAFLDQLMPLEKVKQVYNPGYTDSYKFDEEFDDAFLNDHVGEFMQVWWKLLWKNPSAYVESYLMQTAGYWHYGETNSVCTQGVTENTLGVTQYDVFAHTLGISLEPLMEKLVLAARKAPLLCLLSSMAIQMFMVWLVILQYLRRGTGRRILPLIPLIILWATIMIATPAFCLLRYLFPVFLLWPFLLGDFLQTPPRE